MKLHRNLFLAVFLSPLITQAVTLKEVYCSYVGNGKATYYQVKFEMSEHPVDPGKKLIKIAAPDKEASFSVYTMRPELKTKQVGGVDKKYYQMQTQSTNIVEKNGFNVPQVQASYGASDLNEVYTFFVSDNAGYMVDFSIVWDFNSYYANVTATRPDGTYPYARSCTVTKG